jgi:hypothetical protein
MEILRVDPDVGALIVGIVIRRVVVVGHLAALDQPLTDL